MGAAVGALRFTLKTLNAAMLFLGVAVLTYSGVMWEQYESGGGGVPPAPVPPDSGPPSAKRPAPWCAPCRVLALVLRTRIHYPRALRALALTRSPDASVGLHSAATKRRFVYAAAAVGGLLASTGATGMAGATAHSPRCCMTAHTAQMLLLLSFEARPLFTLYCGVLFGVLTWRTARRRRCWWGSASTRR